jgi:periplasmic protein TonB
MSASHSKKPAFTLSLPANTLKILAAAFAVGLLLFLIVWMQSRKTYDFYKADGSSVDVGQIDTLPAPLPPDFAHGDNASGLDINATTPAKLPAAPPQQTRTTPATQAATTNTPSSAVSNTATTSATPINTPAPDYPAAAMRQGAGGTVQVKLSIAANGSVSQLDIVKTSGNRALDRAALSALRRWTFQPATQNGQPVSSEVVVPITFNPNG